MWSVQVEWDATTNVVKSAIVDEVSATAPLDTDAADLEAAVDGFAAWGADAGKTGAQFAFSFFEDDNEFYFEAEDTTSIWANSGARAGVAGNVETAEFVLVGAASLTAAASVIVASLLF